MTDQTVRILAFAGSTRTESLNRKLASIAAEGVRSAGAEVTLLELRDLPMPLYDADSHLEGGFPENARIFRDLVGGHDGYVISTPEYNHGLPPLLKNALDWASRPESKNPPGFLFRRKPATMFTAAPGNYGGIRVLPQLREILAALGVFVLPGQLALARAKSAFTEEGELANPNIEAEVLGLTAELVTIAAALGSLH